jgi:hypothetical protein
MTNHSFSKASRSLFNVTTKKSNLPSSNFPITTPYDTALKLNRKIIYSREDPTADIYSIDAFAFLQLLTRDKFEELSRITLAVRPDWNNKSDIAVWDVWFNNIPTRPFNAVVMTASENYSPLTTSRVITASPFLDYTKKVSRVHLNRIENNEIIGIGIYDSTNEYTYVLIYQIDGKCEVDVTNEGKVTSVPCVNLNLLRAHRIDDQGSANTVDIGDDQYSDNESPFVEHIFNSVNEVTEAYPWKPHFLPFTPKSFNTQAIEDQLNSIYSEINNDENPFAIEGRYEDFEEFCRLAYKEAKVAYDNQKDVPTEQSKDKRKNYRKPRREAKLPIALVYKIDEYYVGSVAIGDIVRSVKFHENTLGNRKIVETYLTNSDVNMNTIMDNSQVLSLILSRTEAVFRYLTINF